MLCKSLLYQYRNWILLCREGRDKFIILLGLAQMSLHSEFRVLTGLFGVVFALSACSSAPFPEIVEEDDYTTASSSESGFDAVSYTHLRAHET